MIACLLYDLTILSYCISPPPQTTIVIFKSLYLFPYFINNIAFHYTTTMTCRNMDRGHRLRTDMTTELTILRLLNHMVQYRSIENKIALTHAPLHTCIVACIIMELKWIPVSCVRPVGYGVLKLLKFNFTAHSCFILSPCHVPLPLLQYR